MQRYLLARPQRHDDDPHPISKPAASYARATWPRPWLRNRGIQRDRKPYRTEHRYRRPPPPPPPSPSPHRYPENLTLDQNYQ